jgi:hypothetical protein
MHGSRARGSLRLLNEFRPAGQAALDADDAVRVQPRISDPIGATVLRGGIDFSIFSEHATAVTLGLFIPEGRTNTTHGRWISRAAKPTWGGLLPNDQRCGSNPASAPNRQQHRNN